MAGEMTRDKLAELLNEDLSREYQAIIAYVVYSQVLKGAEYMSIADQLEKHAHQELEHALTVSRQIDYLGKMPSVTPKPVKTSEKARDMLKFDLDNEAETIRNYRDAGPPMRRAGRVRDGGADSGNSCAGAGPSHRSGHGPWRGSSRSRRSRRPAHAEALSFARREGRNAFDPP